MSDSPNVVEPNKGAEITEQQNQENVLAFLEHCKAQNFESILVIGLRDGGLYATQCGVSRKIDAIGMLHMASDAFLHNL